MDEDQLLPAENFQLYAVSTRFPQHRASTEVRPTWFRGHRLDYDPKADITLTFFKTVQDKLRWTSHGRTAAELIHERAGAGKPNMGLTTWKNAPAGPAARPTCRSPRTTSARRRLPS